jgi:MoaA/NifB/PqqE/SkfB family radical SAM enzyme
MKFFEGGIARLATSALTKDQPVYVQFYVTARCNLACEQCNVIYANADQEEATTEQCRLIGENLARIGTSIVLITGGEPFVRKDIVEVIEGMMQAGVHPRLQTNGVASEAQLERLSRIGAHDISISLDSVVPPMQDTINGGYDNSWERAIRTISAVNRIFPSDSFSALGCVLAPRNLDHILSVIDFATAIGWWVSLVPAHVTRRSEPRSFSTYDPALQFDPKDFPRLYETLQKVKARRDAGALVYDSDEYLDDIYRFITGKPVEWRRRNGGVCDSPNLYFAIQPNGDMAVCCDYRLGTSYKVYDPGFPDAYRSGRLRQEARAIAERCTGCMYGSFPEITISMRYFVPMLARARFFLGGTRNKLQPYTPEQMFGLARDIAHQHGLMP